MKNKSKKKKNFLIKILNVLSWVLFAFILSFIFISAADKATGYNVPFLGYRASVIVSSSMSKIDDSNTYLKDRNLEVGQIQVYDLIITKEFKDPSSYKEDDVVSYLTKSGDLICHRVVDVYEKDGTTYFVTKGDANNALDEPFSFDRIRGKVVKVVPEVGTFIKYVQSPYAWIGFCGTGFSFCLYLLISSSSKKYAKKLVKGSKTQFQKIAYSVTYLVDENKYIDKSLIDFLNQNSCKITAQEIFSILKENQSPFDELLKKEFGQEDSQIEFDFKEGKISSQKGLSKQNKKVISYCESLISKSKSPTISSFISRVEYLLVFANKIDEEPLELLNELFELEGGNK